MSDPAVPTLRIRKVRSRYVDRAQRYALSSLTGAFPQRTDDAKVAIAQATYRLAQEWRARVFALRTAGWKRPHGASLNFTLNCPPVGVLTSRRSPPCNQYGVCPFCWCRRYVQDTFQRLEYAFYARDRKKPRPFDLVEMTTTERLPVDQWTLRDMLVFI